MSYQIVNGLGQVAFDEAEELVRKQKARDMREGESFAATTDCPWCEHLAVHWLDWPRFKPVRDDTPHGRAIRMINDSIEHMGAIHRGPTSSPLRPAGDCCGPRVCPVWIPMGAAMTKCVCGHPSGSHFAHEGQCHDCGCSYFLEDNGIEPVEIVPRYQPYVGFYALKQWAV